MEEHTISGVALGENTEVTMYSGAVILLSLEDAHPVPAQTVVVKLGAEAWDPAVGHIILTGEVGGGHSGSVTERLNPKDLSSTLGTILVVTRYDPQVTK